MGKAEVAITWEFPKLLESFQGSRDRIERTIAGTIQTQVGMRFDAEGAYNGHEKWKPLAMRQGQILSLSGALRKSIAPDGQLGKAGPDGFVRSHGPAADMVVEVGTKLIYASTHDKGAVIVPKQKRALRYMNPASGAFVFSMRSEIPKRSFTDLNSQDEQEINETVANLVASILSEASA